MSQINVSNVSIDGVAIKCPSSASIERYRLEKGGRNASGLMCIDIIALKCKLVFKYEVLSAPDLDTILARLNTYSPYCTVRWHERNKDHQATMYAGAIKYDRFRMDGVQYYKNVSFDLIER